MPPGIGMRTRRSASPASLGRQSGTLVADGDRQRPRQRRRVEVGPAMRDGGGDLATLRAEPRCPGGEVDVFHDLREEVRALARAQHLGRPRERAVLRQQHLVHARRRRGAQDRADVARILQVVEQQVKGQRRRQRGRRRGNHGQRAHGGGHRRHFGEQGAGHPDDVVRGHARGQRGDPRIVGHFLHDQQRLRRADAIQVDADQVLAFEDATARLAAVARRCDEPRG